MAFLAVTSLMRTIELQFLHPQPRVILINTEQIKSVHEKLGHLLVFLEECEKKANSCAEMKEVTDRIREVTAKAEEDIEEALLKVHQYHKLDQTLQRVVQGIEELMQITRNTNHLVNDNNPTVGASSQPTPNVEDAMVGHSEELDEVKSQLLRDSLEERQVIAMVGMGGIGKTTFAKKIYNDPVVTSHFMLRAWVTMSQEHNKLQALTDLIRCILPMSKKKVEGDPQELLRKSLLGQRYLVIVDDIWTTNAWDDIQGCFPDENNGSRILLTTRITEIAQYANSNSGQYSYNLRLLNSNEGWDLFYQKLLEKEFLNNEFETIGRNIVQKCHGLPLTIVVLAGLLSTIKSVDEWKNIEATINSLPTSDHDQQFSRILDLSYRNMPSHLKGCFLYLGVYHEDCDIPVKKLIRLWIAEGFIDTMSPRKMLEEVGGKYLQDLIDRSLVMVHGRSFHGKIKTCRMHDLLRELCVSKAKTENLLCLETKGSYHGFDHFVRLRNRWLSLKVVNPHHHLVIASRKCRSIICFNMVANCDYEWYLYANSFKRLRVLDLSKINFEAGMPPDITDLVFLRYLALASCKTLDGIPLWKNWNLQTLLVTEDDNGARKLPPGVWDLAQLRHLQIHHQVSIDFPKAVQQNLQTLYWLSASQCTSEVFLRIPNVKELGIIVGREASPHGLNNLCCVNGLEKLRVQGSYYPLHLPPQTQIFPQNLKELTFVKTLIPWGAMSIVSTLHNLEVLKLRNFACVGQQWELIEEGSFPELKVLLISLTNLKEWNTYVDCPFPKLERLLLRNCFELKELPNWIEDINTLQLIKLEHCYSSLVTSANTIKEQLGSYGNDMLDVEESNTRSDEDHIGEEEEYSNQQSYGEESVSHNLTSLWFEARKLRIPGNEDPSYWSWTFENGYEITELLKMSWFEIGLTCDIRCLSKMTRYSAYLVFKLEPGKFKDVNSALTCVRYAKDKNLYGWLRGENRNSQVFLAKTKSYGDCGRFPDARSDGWMEIKLGDFFVCSGNEGEVVLQLWHVSDQYWLSGFVVKGIQIRAAN